MLNAKLARLSAAIERNVGMLDSGTFFQRKAKEMESFELVTDENGTEKRQNYKSQDRAITAWKRATRRNSCFSAKLYRYADKVSLIADYDSE
jgi:hypothetical protein